MNSFLKVSKGLFGANRGFSSQPLGETSKEFDISKVKSVQPSRQAKWSQLSNGIKVATINDNVNTGVSVGVFINSGTRNETADTFGATFYLKRMGFQSTNSRTSLRLAREIENLGATYRVSSGREQIVYSSEFPADKLDDIVPILSDVVSPALLDWEVRDELPLIEQESHVLESCPRTLVFELLHQEAYLNKGLGNALLPPLYNLHHITSDVLLNYIATNYTNDKISVVATGNVDHDNFAKVAEKSFGNLKFQFFDNEDKAITASTSKPQESKYVGGDIRIAAEGDTYLALGFEGTKIGSKDVHAFATLQFLLGGGNSSYAAIGNGATSNLYRSVLGESSNNWLKEISAFNVNYTDSGLFGVYATAKAGHGSQLAQGITKGIKSVFASLNENTLKAAKLRYKADLHFSNESRTNLMEFIGSQSLTSKVESIEEVSKQIDAITLEDVKRVSSQILSSNPTLVAVGDITNIPSSKDILKQLS